MTGIQELGANCLIGAGAVVINNVDENAIVASVPAKLIKYKNN
jgi:acetyltransferase-like isoleucine patch superfamily enzyme